MKNNMIGQLSRNTAPTSARLFPSAIRPQASRTPNTNASTGLPSRYCCGVSIVCPICSHCDTGREPIMRNHSTGIHSAFDVLAPRSWSSQNNPAMAAAKAKVASDEDMRCLIQEPSVQQFQRQHFVDRRSVVSIALQVSLHDSLDALPI